MKSLRVPKKWALFSTAAFFAVSVLTSQSGAPRGAWDSILSYMVSLMGALGLFILAIQKITSRDVTQSAQSEKTRVHTDHE